MAKTGKPGQIASGRVSENRRARHDYAIEETVEAGLVLTGTEVKALRAGLCSIAESYAGLRRDEDGLWLLNADIGHHQPGSPFAHERKRPRKLLLRRREIDRLSAAVARKGMTLVPLALHFDDRGIAKLSLALGRGKDKGDKREDAKKRDWQRDKARLLRAKG